MWVGFAPADASGADSTVIRYAARHGASILGVRLTGAGFDRQWLPVVPGVTTVLLGKNGSGKTNSLCGVLQALMVAVEIEWDVVHLATDVLRGPSGGGSFLADPNADLAPVSTVVLQPHMDSPYGRGLFAAALSDDIAASSEWLDGIDMDIPALISAYSAQSNSQPDAAFLRWCAELRLVAIGEKELSPAITPEHIDMTSLDLATQVLRGPAEPDPDDDRPSPVREAAQDVLDGRAAFSSLTPYGFMKDLKASLGGLLALSVPRAVAVDFSLDGVSGSLEDEVKQRTFAVAQNICRSGKSEQPSTTNAKTIMPRILAVVAQRANEIAPKFVLQYGVIRLDVRDGFGPWDPPVLTVRQIDGKNRWNIRDLGRGVASWAAAAVRIALAQIEDALWGVEVDGHWVGTRYRPGWQPPRCLQWLRDEVNLGIRPTPQAAFDLMFREPTRLAARLLDPLPHVYLFDEPERHLHLAAVRDVLEVVDGVVQLGAACVVATHAPALIDLPESRSLLVLAVPGVPRDTRVDDGDAERADRPTGSSPNNRLEVSAGIGLGELRRRASEIGVDPSSLLHITKGIIFVEGTNDKWVIERFFKDALAGGKVEVLPLSGGRAVTGLAELALLWTLGKPVVVMLDNVRRELLNRLLRGRTDFKALRPEEQWVASLSTSLRRKNIQLHVTGIDAPDIICSIADSDISAAITALGGNVAGFPGWRKLLKSKGPRRFKQYFSESVGASVEQVLSTLRRQGIAGQPSLDLKTAVNDALTYIATHQWHSPDG